MTYYEKDYSKQIKKFRDGVLEPDEIVELMQNMVEQNHSELYNNDDLEHLRDSLLAVDVIKNTDDDNDSPPGFKFDDDEDDKNILNENHHTDCLCTLCFAEKHSKRTTRKTG